MHNPKSILEKETHKLFCNFEIQTELPISARRPDQIIVKKKKKKRRKKSTCRIVVSAVPADNRVKLKESKKKKKKEKKKKKKKRDKYLDLARELDKKLLNVKVKVIPIVIGALGTVIQQLVQELEYLEKRGRVETI